MMVLAVVAGCCYGGGQQVDEGAEEYGEEKGGHSRGEVGGEGE